MAEDFYAVLGVHRNATEAQIRDRFRELVRTKHPDRFQGEEKLRAEHEFQRITEAANVLGSYERRRRHDAELDQAKANASSSGGTERELGKVYMQRGVKAYKEGNHREAADNFDRATKADPGNAKAWHSLALACSQDARWRPQAQAAIVKACELEPMKVIYLKAAGRIFQASGVSDKAENYYRLALQWGGDDPEVNSALEELLNERKGRSRLSSLFGR